MDTQNKQAVKSSLDLLDVTKQAIEEFSQKNYKYDDKVEKILQIQMTKYLSDTKSGKNKPTLSQSFYTDDVKDSLTVKQKEILDELHAVFTDKNLNLSSLLLKIEDIEQKTERTLSENEQFIVYVATSIAKNTIQYWHNNIEKWIELALFNKNKKIGNKTKQQGVVIRGRVTDDHYTPIYRAQVNCRSSTGEVWVETRQDGTFEAISPHVSYPVHGYVYYMGTEIAGFGAMYPGEYMNVILRSASWDFREVSVEDIVSGVVFGVLLTGTAVITTAYTGGATAFTFESIVPGTVQGALAGSALFIIHEYYWN